MAGKPTDLIIPDRVSIHLRPETAKTDLEFGHWEETQLRKISSGGIILQVEEN